MRSNVTRIGLFAMSLFFANAVLISTHAQTVTTYGTGSGTGGSEGSYFGLNSGAITTGAYNSFFGAKTGEVNTTGYYNSFFGWKAGLKNTTGAFNLFAGFATGLSNTTGVRNSFLGTQAGNENSTGSNNTYVGYASMNANTIGLGNASLGANSGYRSKTGSKNTLIGAWAGYKNIDGSGNVFLGYYAGRNEMGSNKLYIASDTLSGNPLIYGEFDNKKLVFDGRVGVSTSAFPTTIGGADISSYQLFVKGGILAEEVRIRTGWADYVFAPKYKLRPLGEVENFILRNGHLPNVPSASVVENEGISLGEMAKIQQEKIEELTLYIIQQEKRIIAQDSRLENLGDQLRAVKHLLKELSSTK